jgi:virginiamycin B lyase
METSMSRISRILLAAAVGGFLITLTVQAQAPGGGRQGAPGRGRGQAVELPEGPGKALVQSACVACHQLNLVTGSSGFDQKGWRDLVATMVALPEAQLAEVSGYLAAHFPEKPGRRPTLVAGDATISIKEWVVPTLGQRPRDPIQLPDGTIWWAGMYASLIGRLNPATGEMREYKLATDARPHSIVGDSAGHIWYTGNGNGTVGRLDPSTGSITVHKMPDPAARDPHTAVFDQKGTLWFTLQQANMVGRLNPQTGDVKLVTMPSPRSLPYGMVVSSTGVPFLVEFGANRVASLDPATMAIKEYPLPNAETRPRRIAITSDDAIWYSDYSRGYLGRLDPKTGAVKEWPSPSGPRSQPYGITVAKGDIVWYSESAVKPNTLVRFDPKTEKFQTWAIPSGGGVVRNMMATADGNSLVLACSGVNRVAWVDIK